MECSISQNLMAYVLKKVWDKLHKILFARGKSYFEPLII